MEGRSAPQIVDRAHFSHLVDAIRADVPHADAVFLLAKRKDGQIDDIVDTKTILTSTFLQSIMKESASKRIFVQVLLPVRVELGRRNLTHANRW